MFMKTIPKEVDKSSGHRRQFIDVEFNFIGKVTLPPGRRKNGITDIATDYAEFFKDYNH